MKYQSVTVSAHTDRAGDMGYNQDLAQKRALATVDMI